MMQPGTDMTLVAKKKKKLSIPKNLDMANSWHIIAPQVAKEFGGEYRAIPFFLETTAYEVAHIFASTKANVKCFCAPPVVQILGPVWDFVVPSKSNAKFTKAANFQTTTSTTSIPNLRLGLMDGDKQIIFTAYDYYYVDIANDATIENNVTIDRSSHEDLKNASWIGFITGTIAAHVYEINIMKNGKARVVSIGDKPHTIFFKYEICDLDSNGTVTRSVRKKVHLQWLPMGEEPINSLPLPTFVSRRRA